MDVPRPRVVVEVGSPLLADALGRLLQRRHGAASSEAEPVEVLARGRDAATGADYVLRLPDVAAEPAVLLSPDGTSTTVVLPDVGAVSDLVGGLLRRP